MRRTWIVLAGTVLLIVSLFAGTFLVAGAVADTHAMGLMNPMSWMNHGPHGHMHGSGDMDAGHARCQAEMNAARCDEHQAGMTQCPYGHDDSHPMRSMMHGWSGNHDHHRGQHENCPMFGTGD